MKRLINGIIAIAIAVIVTTLVVVEWKSQGCDIKSLVAGSLWYWACTASVWLVVDSKIKEA